MKIEFKPGDLVLIDKERLSQAYPGQIWTTLIDDTKKHTISSVDGNTIIINCHRLDSVEVKYWMCKDHSYCLSFPLLSNNKKPKYTKFLQKLALLSLLLFVTTTYAESPQSSKMRKEVVRAIRSYPETREVEKRAMHKGIKTVQDKTDLSYGSLKVLGAMGMTAIQGKVSSKDIPIKTEIGGATLRPVIEYGLQGQGVSSGVFLQYEF